MEPCTFDEHDTILCVFLLSFVVGSVHWLCHVVTCEARTLEITCIYLLVRSLIHWTECPLLYVKG